jgi:hypothetical protein
LCRAYDIKHKVGQGLNLKLVMSENYDGARDGEAESDTNTFKLGNMILKRHLRLWNGNNIEEGMHERNDSLPGDVFISQGVC